MRFDNGLAIEKPFLHDYLPTWFQQYDQELEKKKLPIFLSDPSLIIGYACH